MPYNPSNADTRGGVAYNGRPSLTVAEAASQLTREGLSWATGGGTAVTITYAFRDFAPSHIPNGASGFEPFSPAQILATERALAMWATVANIRFVRAGGDPGSFGLSSNATILFGNYTRGPEDTAAFAIMPGDPTPASAAGDVWLNGNYFSNRSPASSEGFHTLLHEIGHALGLSHPGEYDSIGGESTYLSNAGYAEDSLEYSVMSYFDATETGAITGGLSAWPGTPLIDDIAAIQRLYGPNMAARPGATTYGTGTIVFAGQPPYNSEEVELPRWGTIWDGGGIDTVVLPQSGTPQALDLRPGAFSRYDGQMGVLSIAVGTVIENGRVWEPNSTLIGNTAANILWGTNNSVYTGGGGDDVFMAYAYQWVGSSITDFGVGDRLVVLDTQPATFTYALEGSRITFVGGAVTLTGVTGATFVAEAFGSGTALRLISSSKPPSASGDTRHPVNDFNGDGRSDILWRNVDGHVSEWLTTSRGGYLDNAVHTGNSVPTAWKVVATGDISGDGRSDILWRNSDGQLSKWLGTATGGFADIGGTAGERVSTDWKVVALGDLNGDGHDDIVWRNDNGTLSNWLGTASGGFIDNGVNSGEVVSNAWMMAAIADINGDGRHDILWRSESGQLSKWLGTPTGRFADIGGTATEAVPTAWKIAGTGDFNGDGRDDILWRNQDGFVSEWLGTVTGGFADNGGQASVMVSVDWKIAGTGDYNGDGFDDILWRHDNGSLSNWLGTATGRFVDNGSVGGAFAPLDWAIQPSLDLF